METGWGKVFDWKPGERRITLLMAANYFLFLLFFYLLKPARDSLFLVHLEPSNLPYVYLVTAFLAAPLISAHARAGGRMRLERITVLTLLLLMTSLTLMRLLINVQHDAVYFLFYGLVAVAGGVTTSQFWLMANAVFDSAQARRLFPVLGVGGIAGAFVGGEVTGFLVDYRLVDTNDLILAAVIVLGLAGMVTLGVWRCNPLIQETPQQEAEGESVGAFGVLKSVWGSRHLRLTVIILSLGVMTGTLVDFQFMNIAWQTHTQPGDLTSFLGKFYGRVSLVSLLLQLVFTSRLLRKLGAGGVLFILPSFLVLGSTFMLIAPGLLAGIVMRGTHQSLKHSIDKTSRELLFLPVSMALKKRTKLFMDTVVDRVARGLAGALLLVCGAIWSDSLFHVGVITLVLLALWLIATFFMRSAYIDTFRQAVARRHFGLSDMKIKVNDSSSLKTLATSLNEGSDHEVIFSLRLLDGINEPSLLEVVRPHLNSDSSEVRRLALEYMARTGSNEDVPLVQPLLDDPELQVRIEAIAFMGQHWKESSGPETCLGEMLNSSPAARNGVLAYLSQDNLDEDRLAIRDLVDERVVSEVFSDQSEWALEGKLVLARLPWLPRGCDDSLWDRLIGDENPDIVCAACAGIGIRGDLSRASLLFARLSRPSLRSSAREALVVLAKNEPHFFPELENFIHNYGAPLTARMEIPRVLSRLVSQESVDILLRHLATHIPEMRFQSLKGLNRLRVSGSKLVFDPRIVDVEINLEAHRYLQLELAKGHLHADDEATRLLLTVLSETQDLRLESVFRLMGLTYQANDVAGAYERIMGHNRQQRADAQEFLDNILTESHRRLLRSLLEKENLQSTARILGIDHSKQPRNEGEALDFLSRSCDPWLAACASHAGSSEINPAAEIYLTRKADDMLTPVEKVMLLKEIDVFQDLPTDLLAALATSATEKHCLEGQVLVKENQIPGAMYIIVEGAVNMFLHGQHVVTNLRGEEVGVWELFHGVGGPMGAVVGQDAMLLRINREDFNELLAGDIRVAKSIMQFMAGYLMYFVNKYGWPGKLEDLAQEGQVLDNPPRR